MSSALSRPWEKAFAHSYWMISALKITRLCIWAEWRKQRKWKIADSRDFYFGNFQRRYLVEQCDEEKIHLFKLIPTKVLINLTLVLFNFYKYLKFSFSRNLSAELVIGQIFLVSFPCHGVLYIEMPKQRFVFCHF